MTPMRDEVVERLTQVNRGFYQSFAGAFSETRGRLQPGVQRVLKKIPHDASVLDLGCGNGMVGSELHRHGHRGAYLGIDSSRGLLELARGRLEGTPARFLLADLTSSEWDEGLDARFDRVFAFAVLHHVPGEQARQRLLQQIRTHMTAEGQLIVSTWDVLSSERLRQKVVPWERIGLAPEDVDPHDCLIDWRHGGYGIRYVHSFDDARLEALATAAGFAVQERFRSDGQGGRMSIYQVWTCV
jgi:SAM-dependent methyltransferase